MRLGQALVTTLWASALIFALLPLTGDPALAYSRDRGSLAPSPAQLERVRAQLGLDHSLVTQYAMWLGRALHGDFGVSSQSGLPVRAELLLHLRYTLVLAGPALIVALFTSLGLGLVSGAWARRWPDTAIRGFSSLGVAIPDFVVGLILLVVVGLHTGTVVSDGALSHVALPVAALALFPAARWTQILRVELSAERAGPGSCCITGCATHYRPTSPGLRWRSDSCSAEQRWWKQCSPGRVSGGGWSTRSAHTISP